MQQTPVHRTLRLIIFSIGFVLFVTMAFRAGSQASDARALNGKPSLFTAPHSLALLQTAAAATADDTAGLPTVATASTSQSQPSGMSKKAHAPVTESSKPAAPAHKQLVVAVPPAGHGAAPHASGPRKLK